MQNTVEREGEEVTIYEEYSEGENFIVREMLESKNPEMKFQVGHYVNRPKMMAVYNEDRLIGYRESRKDQIQVLHLHGIGRTKEEALTRASNKLLREELAAI